MKIQSDLHVFQNVAMAKHTTFLNVTVPFFRLMDYKGTSAYTGVAKPYCIYNINYHNRPSHTLGYSSAIHSKR